MDIRSMTVETLMRQLSLCDKNAEIMVTIGDIPIAIPANSFSVKENAQKREIVSINIDYKSLSDVVELGNKMLNTKKRVVKKMKDVKKIKQIKKGKK